MSYDLIIRSDDACSLHTDAQMLLSYLATLPGVHILGPTQCSYGSPESGIFLTMELVLLSDQEARGGMYKEGQRKVNALICRIPYAFLEKTDEAFYNHYLLIAEHLGWRIYDYQQDKYFDEMLR